MSKGPPPTPPVRLVPVNRSRPVSGSFSGSLTGSFSFSADNAPPSPLAHSGTAFERSHSPLVSHTPPAPKVAEATHVIESQVRASQPVIPTAAAEPASQVDDSLDEGVLPLGTAAAVVLLPTVAYVTVEESILFSTPEKNHLADAPISFVQSSDADLPVSILFPELQESKTDMEDLPPPPPMDESLQTEVILPVTSVISDDVPPPAPEPEEIVAVKADESAPLHIAQPVLEDVSVPSTHTAEVAPVAAEHHAPSALEAPVQPVIKPRPRPPPKIAVKPEAHGKNVLVPPNNIQLAISVNAAEDIKPAPPKPEVAKRPPIMAKPPPKQ